MVCYFNTSEYVSLEELCESCDFVSVHCALTSETRGMFNAALFKRMRKDAIFVNTARWVR